jgi:hypothetical protein
MADLEDLAASFAGTWEEFVLESISGSNDTGPDWTVRLMRFGPLVFMISDNPVPQPGDGESFYYAFPDGYAPGAPSPSVVLETVQHDAGSITVYGDGTALISSVVGAQVPRMLTWVTQDDPPA